PIVASVDLAVPVAPLLVWQGGDMQLVYELHITNFLQTSVSLAAVTVQADSGHELARYDNDELRRRVTRPGLRNDHATPQLIAPGMRAIVNLWMTVPLSTLSASGFSLRSLRHIVDLDVLRPAETVRTRVAGGAVVPALVRELELDAPLRGGPWIAIYDPLLKGGHRTAVYTLDGRARIPGRFAIDFIALPDGGVLPAVRAPDSNGFGAEVLAVADGTITIAVDGVADATPPPIALEQASGNHVAIDLGDGRFAFYEHLQRGSVAVKVGQRVTRGQLIARLGSSGSSSIGPHLHFHVADANSTLAAEGMPFVFRQFGQLGRFASLTALISGEKWLPASVAETRRRERPDPVTVISFP
ncbi:MAG: M23 family metallopeptidase, partial [Vicinamibacterales bacterium]